MSHPLCDDAGMRPDEAAEPVEWDLQALKRTYDEWNELASQMIESLRQELKSDGSVHWRPHATQIVKTIAHLRDRCTEASATLGRWREDGLQSDEMHELVWAEADQLVQWLKRMMNF